ncbi:MAG: choice-of-anchor U domain-containing protein [Cellvibrionaceae bacterium]
MSSVLYPAPRRLAMAFFTFILSLSLTPLTANAAPADGNVTWSTTDKDVNVTLSNNDLDASVSGSAGAGVFGIRSSSGISSGDGFFYLEVERVSGSNPFTVGVATASVPLTAVDTATIEGNAESAVTGELWDTVSIAIDYRGPNPVVHLFGDRFGDNSSLYSITEELSSVTGTVFLYVAGSQGEQYRINFGGTDGAAFERAPTATIETILYNGGALLEYGMPIARTKPSLSITEGSQLAQQNASVTFTAVATDADSADISTSVEWFLDGVSQGASSTISPSTAIAGTYKLKAVVEDSEELSSELSVDLYVHPSSGGGALDQDQDGLTYDQEITASSNPARPDSDGDGLSDGYEVANGSDPNVTTALPAGFEAHEDTLFFNFENSATSHIVSTSDDGYSVGYIPGIDGKAAIRANQGMKGEFRYWEGQGLFDGDLGYGLIGPSEPINDYCCTSFPVDPQDFSALDAPGSSMGINTFGDTNGIWQRLVFQTAYTNNDSYIGLAVDYTGSTPVVYVLGTAGLETTINLPSYNSLEAIFPMFYGNLPTERDAIALQTANFGQEPFFYDPVQVLTDAGVSNLASFVPGWGKHRQLQHLSIDVLSQTADAGDVITLNATATDASGANANAAITWTIFDESDVDVTDDLASVAAPVTGSSITFTPATAETFTIRAEVTDSKTGQAFSRIATVTTGDGIAPTITAPADIEVATFGTSVPASYAEIDTFLNAAVGADNSGTFTITHDAPASFSNAGPTTVTFTVTDSANNTATDTATVTVVTGVLNAPANITVDTEFNSVPVSNADIQLFLEGRTTTNGVSISIDSNDAPATFALGSTTTVEFTATDAIGATDTATATIEITDSGEPVLTAPSDIFVATFGSSVPASYAPVVAFLNAASATDNSGSIASLTNNAPSSFPAGTPTIVTFTARDATGNESVETATVTVTQGQLIPPAGIQIASSASSVPASNATIVSYLAGTSTTDGITISSQSNDAPSSFAAATSTTVTFTATDPAGNSDTAISTVDIIDEGSPTITAPSSIVVPIVGASVTESYAPIAAFLSGYVASDNSGVAPLVSLQDVPFAFEVGSDYVITFTATDADNNSTSTSSTISVVVDNPPVISLGQSTRTVQAESATGILASSTAIADILNAVTASDSEDGSLSVSNDAPSEFPIGLTTVTFTATDNAGPTTNTTEGTMLVQVVEALGSGDSDGDGQSDSDEGTGDSDNDGIPDYLDDNSDTTELPTDSGDNIVVESGIRVTLGETAFATGEPTADITMEDIIDFGDAGDSVSNGVDTNNAYPLGIFDFEVQNLSAVGDSAYVVIPLESAIPADAVYRKYIPSQGWADFVINTDNRVYSAAKVAGQCPVAADAAYTQGLTEGNDCLQLYIQDGGPNDADGAADGVIKDPGGISVVLNVLAERSSTSTPSSFSNNSGEEVVFNFVMNSNSTGSVVNGLSFLASGSLDELADIGVVNLYLDANNDGIPDAGELVGTQSYLVDDGLLSFDFSSAPVSLSLGENVFLVTYTF